MRDARSAGPIAGRSLTPRVRVEVVLSHDDADGRHLLALIDRAADRVEASVVWVDGGARSGLRPALFLARRWRRTPPDVAVVSGASACKAVVVAARLTGVRVVLSARERPPSRWARLADGLAVRQTEDTSTEAARLAATVTTAAGRPGAGLSVPGPASVVVSVLNEGEAIDAVLDALVPQLAADDELIVVDGGSTDDTVPRVRRRAEETAQVRLIEEPGANISAARNAGIASAAHPVIVCTDAGCTPVRDWLEALKRAFAERPPPDLVSGVYRVGARHAFGEALALACYPQVREARQPGPLVRLYGALFGVTFDPSLPTGRSLAFTRDTWSAAGGFPEALSTAEDVSFGQAVAASGRHCALSVDACVTWEARPSVLETARMYYRYGVGDGRSRAPRLVGRNLVRLGAYAAVPVAARGGPVARSLVLAGGALYLSLPLLRAVRDGSSPVVPLLIPAALALKDVSKAVGCLAGLARPRDRGDK